MSVPVRHAFTQSRCPQMQMPPKDELKCIQFLTIRLLGARSSELRFIRKATRKTDHSSTVQHLAEKKQRFRGKKPEVQREKKREPPRGQRPNRPVCAG